MTLPEYYENRIEFEPNTGCWLWVGYVSEDGYGQTWRGDAHRNLYQILCGPIPKGLELDHLCRVRRCVNPKHLEPVTKLENHRRGSRASQTHCLRGHEFNEENTYRYKNRRCCRKCNLIHARKVTS